MITLNNKKIKVVIAPEMGMAIIDFTVDNISILNLDLKDAFYKSRKGLGPIILPHFNQDSPVSFKKIDPSNEIYKLFPHIKYLQELNIFHPFQHGIGRYVAWNFKINNNTVIGNLSGNDRIGSFSLKELNGFDFYSTLIYELLDDHLNIKFKIRGEKPIATGIHFYYDLVDGKSLIYLNAYHEQKKTEMISLKENHNDILTPIADENGVAHCFLKTSQYSLLTKFMVQGEPDEVFESLIVFSNIDKKFVCIEPVSYAIGKNNTKLIHNGEIQLIPHVSR